MMTILKMNFKPTFVFGWNRIVKERKKKHKMNEWWIMFDWPLFLKEINLNVKYIYILATLHELEPLVSDAEDRKPVEKYANYS